VRETGGIVSRIPAFFHSKPFTVTGGEELDMQLVLNCFNAQVNTFNARGSGYVSEHIRRFTISIVAYRPLAGSSYTPTPKWLMVKNAQ